MTTVYLYGHLGRRFGWRWQLEVSSPAEAVRAIIANRPDFHAYLVRHSAPGYQVFIGPDPVRDAEGLSYPIGRQAIKIVPVVAGAAKSPIIGIIIGVVIIAVAAVSFQYEFIPSGVALAIGAIGVSLVIGGVSQLLAGTPEQLEVSERPANKPSYLFNGPVNTTAQGHPVPIGYGRLRVGSAVISAGITTVGVAT